MKRIALLTGVLALAAGCSGSSGSSSSSGTTGLTTSTTTGNTNSNTTGTSSSSSSTGGPGGTTGQNGSTNASNSSSTGSTGQTNGSTGQTNGSTGQTNGSNGSNGSNGGSTGSTVCPGAGVSNDSCSGATVLTIGTPVAGDTTNNQTDFTLDQNGTCTDVYGWVNDAIYTFTAPADGRYNITVTPTDSNLDAVLVVLDTCAAGNVSACVGGSDNGYNGDPESTLVSMTSGQTYTFLVGSYDCTGLGGYTIQVSQPPANDACSGATALTVAAPGDTQTVSGDTSTASDDVGSMVCGGAGASDVFYALTLTQAAHLVVDVQATGSTPTLNPSVMIYSDCTQAASNAELGCGFALDGVNAKLDFADVPAGSYVIAVDGYSDGFDPAENGPFSMTVTLSATGTAPANDLCANATALTVAAPGDTQTIAVDTTLASNEDMGSADCTTEGADVFYGLTLTANAHLTATLTPTADTADGGSDYLGALALSSACGTLADGGSTDIACVLPQALGAFSIDIPNLVAGSYVLRADNLDSVPGVYSLNVTLSAPILPPANDTCAGAIALTEGTPATGDNTGATNDYTDDGSGSCTTYYLNAPDVVYSFTPSATGSYTFTLTPTDTSSNGPDFALYINDTCPTGPISACLAGADVGLEGEPETVTATLTAGTTYLVFVDGYSATASVGPFSLSVSGP